MSNYPTVITADVLAKNAHVTDETIAGDIAETEAEISRLEIEAEAHRLIADANTGNTTGKMAYFQTTVRQIEIDERRQFIAFLTALQRARAEQVTAVASEAS